MKSQLLPEDEGPVPLVERLRCYEFNREMMDPLYDDHACVHCVKYLTLDCPYICVFLEEFEE